MKANIDYLTSLANNDNVQAQYQLSQLLLDSDPNQAQYWLKRAANNGFLPAHLTLNKLQLIYSQTVKEVNYVQDNFLKIAQHGLIHGTYEFAKLFLVTNQKPFSKITAELKSKINNLLPDEQLQIIDNKLNSINSSFKFALTERQSLLPPNNNSQQLVALIPKVVPKSICKNIIEFRKGHVEPSHVVDPVSGERIRNQIRQSKSLTLDLSEMTLEEAVLLKIVSDIFELGWSNCEPVNLIRYDEDDYYGKHHDCFVEANKGTSSATENNRLYTAILYLNEDYDAGETKFDKLGISLKANTGDMLIFKNMKDGSPDLSLIHEGAKVKGVNPKWVMTFWFREQSLLKESE
ncbi:MAG: 2OG-Fe(II) oxygenase [Gammaproteobacteria bacterium]|nr:2OG-Fe(II) oxygenase [Gammaproteobacteria bacterium]